MNLYGLILDVPGLMVGGTPAPPAISPPQLLASPNTFDAGDSLVLNFPDYANAFAISIEFSDYGKDGPWFAAIGDYDFYVTDADGNARPDNFVFNSPSASLYRLNTGPGNASKQTVFRVTHHDETATAIGTSAASDPILYVAPGYINPDEVGGFVDLLEPINYVLLQIKEDIGLNTGVFPGGQNWYIPGLTPETTYTLVGTTNLGYDILPVSFGTF